MSTQEPVLAARSLHLGYGAVEVVHGIDLELRAGEMVAVLGPNGAGKTTLLSALAGFLRPTKGDIELFGAPFRRPAHRWARAGVSFVGDDRHVFPSLTVRQNMTLVGKDVAALEPFPELRALAGRKAMLLSGGEQQMLALARALATRPRILIVDELSLGLAPLICRRLLAILRQAADQGTGVLVVEQSAKAAASVADRAYVLRRGEVVDTRPAAEWVGRMDELSSLFLG